MIAESINFIDQSIKMVIEKKFHSFFVLIFCVIQIKNEENITDSKEPDSTTLIKYQYKVYEPDQCLSKVELDTTYHRHNHTSSSLKSDLNTDITHRLLDSLCDENVINQIVSNLIEID